MRETEMLGTKVKCHGTKVKCLVDFSEIRHPPVEVGSLSHYLQSLIDPRWLLGISEPSTVGGGFKYIFFVNPLPVELIHFGEHIFLEGVETTK